MRLSIDLDGVCAQFNEAYAKILIKESGRDLFPPGLTWEERPETFVCWDWDTFYGYTPQEIDKAWRHGIKNSTTFWEKLQPLEGATDAIKQLNRMAKSGDDVYFLTNRIGYRAKYQTEKWLYAQGCDYPTVFLVADKVPVIRALGIHFVIDDKLETINDLARVVEEEGWTGMKIYLKDAPYNREGRRQDIIVVGSINEALKAEGLWV